MSTLPRQASLINQRAIIDRRTVVHRLDSIATQTVDIGARRQAMVGLLDEAMIAGRAEIAQRLNGVPFKGRAATRAGSFLIDQIIRIAYDFTTEHLYPSGHRSQGERLALIAVGGYGRAEMAPHSDIDIGFIIPSKRTGWSEQIIESILYALWDLKLKIGYSTRSSDETIRVAKADLTVCTALLESRFLWGDRALYETVSQRFYSEVVADKARQFVIDKLAERDARHRRMGDSRYVVEPNIKEGKGGLRDLHTLFWIGKFIHHVRSVPELVAAGLLSAQELRHFARAENFLLTVRCHLHKRTNRAEDRLTFDYQREIAAQMNFTDRPGQSAVERFMQLYFRHVKIVGDLTGTFLTHLDEQMSQRGRWVKPTLRRRPGKLNGFVLEGGRLAVSDADFFTKEPMRLIEIFALADKYRLAIHPQAMRQARRDAKLIDRDIRENSRANSLFLGVLTSKREPETVLRWMNEAGVFGHFVPDFGRIVAQMQFDMYHHYTVDEHTIRAIGLLSAIEHGKYKDDHPLASAIMKKIHLRRAIYVATLLHDIAKGRGGDHSILGAELALELCPRLGLDAAETETISWLVRYHLLMSATAFKRDLSDFKTILDFVNIVQSAERLRLLLVLTVVDIRAVGPGIWNGWKRQLLTDLFDAAEEVLRLGHKQRGRESRIAAKKQDAAKQLAIAPEEFTRLAERMGDSYWIGEPLAIIAENLRHMHEKEHESLHIKVLPNVERGAVLVMVRTVNHVGLFYRIAGAIHLAGGNIIDARIHTTRDGLVLDNFLVQDPFGRPFDEAEQMARLSRTITDTLANRKKLLLKLQARPLSRARAESFTIVPHVIIDNKASNRFTVIEVTARDYPALLYQLAYALFQAKAEVHSAHITTYGERAVDTFYITSLLGDKIQDNARVRSLEKRLLKAVTAFADEAVIGR